jgi:NitT/TauT family transport system ATP-binding protein
MNVSIRQLSHTYYPPGADPIPALQDLNLEVQAGSFVAIIGPSGCGKSTLLRILAGLIDPSAGQVHIGPHAPHEASRSKLVAWMAQRPALLPWYRLQTNVTLAQRINPRNHRPLVGVRELLRLVRLERHAQAFPATLSGGMQQRAALARTLALGAPLWLMDEPFAALDELTREQLTVEVLALWERFRPTTLWVTHSVLEAARMADRVLVMSPPPGRLILDLAIKQPRPRDVTSEPLMGHVRALRRALGFQ